jgi:hypothetical protein
MWAGRITRSNTRLKRPADRALGLSRGFTGSAFAQTAFRLIALKMRATIIRLKRTFEIATET